VAKLLGSLKELLRIPGGVDYHATQSWIVRVKLPNRVTAIPTFGGAQTSHIEGGSGLHSCRSAVEIETAAGDQRTYFFKVSQRDVTWIAAVAELPAPSNALA
jgi:hypothetical protein